MALFEPNVENFNTLKSTPKTIIITGGSSGIGLATAHLLSKLNPKHNLVLIDLNPPPQTFKHDQSHLLVHTCNITSWTSQRAGFEAAHARFGRIDCVFVNAGIAEHGEQFFTDELDGDGKLKEPDRRVLNIDMDAASDTTKLAIHYLKNNHDGGEIVLTASLAGYLASAGAPLYSAAKHGKFSRSQSGWQKLTRNRCRRPYARTQAGMRQSGHFRLCDRSSNHSHAYLDSQQ